MKRLLSLCAALVLALVTTTAFAAADVTGTWTTQMHGPNGDMQLTFHLKQDGEKLTGSVDGPMGGEPIGISNGKIDGAKVSFDTSVNGMTINHDGTIGDDEITLKVKSDSGQMPAMDIVLKRAKQ